MNNKNWKPRFYILWLGQAVSILSSSVLQMALLWHLTFQTGSAAVLSLASIAGFLPTAVLGLFAGALVDRWNRKLTMVGADLFISAISLVLAVYALFAPLPIWLVLVVLFVRSIGSAFHSPAISAVTPLLVPEEALIRCAGYTQSLQTVGYMAGTAIAALLYPIWSMSALVMLDVVGAVVASLCAAFIHIPQPPAPAQLEKPHLLREMRDGYRVLRQDKALFALLWIGAVFTFLYSPVNALFPLMVIDHFGGGTVQSSVSEIAFAVGMLAGGLALGMGWGFKKRGYTMLGALLIMGVSTAASGLLPANGFAAFLVLCVVMGISAPLYTGPQTAAMQERIEPQYLGRVFGLYGSILSFTMPLGLVLSGLFADSMGVPIWFLICGGACVLLGIAACTMRVVREI